MHVALPLKFADFAGREGPAGPIEFRPRKPILGLLSPHTYIYIYIYTCVFVWMVPGSCQWPGSGQPGQPLWPPGGTPVKTHAAKKHIPNFHKVQEPFQSLLLLQPGPSSSLLLGTWSNPHARGDSQGCSCTLLLASWTWPGRCRCSDLLPQPRHGLLHQGSPQWQWVTQE